MIGISKLAKDDNKSPLTKCRQELIQFLDAIKNNKIWALKLIDSFGNSPKSFHWGNHYWFSSSDLCEDINTPYKITLNNRYHRILYSDIFNSTSPYPVYYRMIYYNFTSPMYIDLKHDIEPYIHVGLCIPKTCEKNEIIKYTNEYFYNQTFEIQKLFDIKMSFIHTKNPKFDWSYFSTIGVILLGGCVILTLCMTLLSLVHENLIKNNDIIKNKQTELSSEGNGSTAIIYDDNNITNTTATNHHNNQLNKNLYEKILHCWSIKSNYNNLIKLNNTTNCIQVIAGMKVIICMWIIALHCSSLTLFVINNASKMFTIMEILLYQFVMQAIFYVDVFFIISSFLLVNNFLSNTKRLQKIKSNCFTDNFKLFLKLVFHRYLRLMPVLIIVMILAESVYDLLDMSTPFYMQKNIGTYCKETWWYNIFLINNFLDLKDVCVSWSWYLSCELQYYILFLLILFVHAKYEIFGKILFILSAAIFVTVSYLMHMHYEFTFQVDVIYQTMKMLYVHPLARISPYFGGALMGWLYFKTKSNKLTLNYYILIPFWTISTVLIFYTINMTYYRLTPIWIVSIIMSYGKLLFSIIIGAIILLCSHNYGGIFNKLMSLNIFLYLYKLSYGAYMLNPIILQILFGLKGDSTTFSETNQLLYCVAVITLSFIGSFFLALFWEIPFHNLSQQIIRF